MTGALWLVAWALDVPHLAGGMADLPALVVLIVTGLAVYGVAGQLLDAFQFADIRAALTPRRRKAPPARP
jgi:hypothetical protein